MKIINQVVFTCVVILSGCVRHSPAPPLVDGNSQEYKTLGVKPIPISQGVDLYIYQNEHYVWLCYDYPDGSFGTLDMKLKTDALDEAINLHVSGQLGEWLVSKPETAPTNPESDRWWNNEGWIANPIWINGMDTTGTKPRYRFKNAKAREVQLSKSRFGKGSWQMQLEIRAIKQPDGTFAAVNFPQDSSAFVLDVN
jgi:hypothetical protein